MESDQRKIRVLVVDDHDLVRAGFVALLNREKDMRIVGEAKNGAEACEKVKSLSPDVALVDINLPAIENIEIAAMIGREHPDVRVLTVTHLDHEECMRKIMESGSRGCISKSCAAEELKQAIRIVHGGGEYFSFTARKGPIHDASPGPGGERRIDLTRRELEVIRRVASGLTSDEIAAELGISIRTVEFHRANIKEKTGAPDAIDLVRRKNKTSVGNARPTVPNPNWPPERIGKTAVPLTAKDRLVAQFFVAGFTRGQVAIQLQLRLRTVKRHQMKILNVFQFKPGTRNIMHLVLAGYTNREIAALLGISPQLVEFRRGQILDIGRN